jgi:hypothetical protein
MIWTRYIAKIVVVNVAIIFMLIGILVAGPIAIIKTYDAFRVIVPISPQTLHQLPNYTDISWASQHFSDHKNIGSSYSDFVVWELDPLSSETINIDDNGRRHTVVPDGISEGSVWVFGGSTVFGTGVNDANTIPSLLAEKTGFKAVNFGGDNYIARQGVNRLLREYENNDIENLIVVFYDGVNDVHVKCRVENLDLVTDRQDQIRGALGDNRAALDASVIQLFGPASVLIDKVSQRGVLGGPGKETDDLFVCDDDADRADQVARALVSDWKAAQAITETNGGRFFAVLQPVAYLSDTRLEHLTLGHYDAEFAKQYSAVYPLIRLYASAAGINFFDLSHVFDHDEFIYIDFCHVSPNGNEYMAEVLATVIS